MDRHVSPPSLNLQIVATVSADELSQQLGPRAADNAGRLNPSACDFASVPSGRILRAHLASFLI